MLCQMRPDKSTTACNYIMHSLCMAKPVMKASHFCRTSAMCIDVDLAHRLDKLMPCFHTIRNCAEYFACDMKLACLALRIFDQYNCIVRKLIPRRDRKVITEDAHGGMFSGTGFVVCRSIFLKIGGFWEDLNPYFGEEPDL